MTRAHTGPPSILIVDDDQEINDIIGMILEGHGYRVRSAENGREALASVKESTPDLVLLDLMMPVMSGWEFRERQQRHPELAAIPVVVMTATPSLEAAAIEAADLLLKPVRPSDLLATVVRHIGEAFDDVFEPSDNEFGDAPNTEPNAPAIGFEDHDSNRHHS